MKIIWLIVFCLVGLAFVAFGIYLYRLVSPQHFKVITKGGLKPAGIAFIVSGSVIVVAGVIGYFKKAL